MRSEAQKLQRKERNRILVKNYQDWYIGHLNDDKSCSKCERNKKVSEFVSNYSHRNICKECHKGKVHKWRDSNPASSKEMRERSNTKSTEIIREYKENRACSLCKKEYPFFVLDYHHLYDKNINVSKTYYKGKDRIKSEIEKCQIICANCHRHVTHEEQDEEVFYKNRKYSELTPDIQLSNNYEEKTCTYCKEIKNIENFTKLRSGKYHSYCRKCLKIKNKEYSSRRTVRNPSSEWIKVYKSGKTCHDCNGSFPYWVLDFDHIKDKEYSISSLRRKPIKILESEIKKCELVCANCHRMRTHNRKKLREPKEKITDKSLNKSILNDFCVSLTKIDSAKAFLNKYHYAGYGRPASILFEARINEATIAIAKFTPVIRQEVATSLGLLPKDVLELDRLCVHPEYQVKNLVSKFLSKVIKELYTCSVAKYLVSFADTGQGHSGTVYRASNWKEIGVSASSYYYIDKLGKRMNKKSLYNKAKSSGTSEKAYASQLGMEKVFTPGKFKFIYELKR